MRLSHYKNENMFEIQKSFVPLHKACNLRLLSCFAHTHRHTQTHTLYFLQEQADHCSFPPLCISTITILVAFQALEASAEMEMRVLCGK